MHWGQKYHLKKKAFHKNTGEPGFNTIIVIKYEDLD